MLLLCFLSISEVCCYEFFTWASRVEHAASLFADPIDLITGKLPVLRGITEKLVCYRFSYVLQPAKHAAFLSSTRKQAY